MHQSFLGLVFNITVLILEYKRAAFAQSFSLGYKPIRPSYFYPDHPGHRPPQLISQGWLWPSDPDESFTTTTVRTTSTQASTTVVQIPNRGPDLPHQPLGEPNNTVEINHWYRPVIITNTISTASGNEKISTTSAIPSTTASTIVSTISTTTPMPTTVPNRPSVQFLPEGDLFTSAPVIGKQASPISTSSPSTTIAPLESTTAATSTVASPELILGAAERNVTFVVADLLPLPIELGTNGSAENLNVFLPVLPLKVVNNTIN